MRDSGLDPTPAAQRQTLKGNACRNSSALSWDSPHMCCQQCLQADISTAGVCVLSAAGVHKQLGGAVCCAAPPAHKPFYHLAVRSAD